MQHRPLKDKRTPSDREYADAIMSANFGSDNAILHFSSESITRRSREIQKVLIRRYIESGKMSAEAVARAERTLAELG